MDNAHWLGRKRASLGMARKAASAEARLIHYDLAGRYSLRADIAAIADAGDEGGEAERTIAPKLTKTNRAQMDDSVGNPKDPEDLIDLMIRQNVELHGA